MKRLDSLRYIRNTDGGATVDHFCEDWAPVGEKEWELLVAEDLAFDDGETHRIHLTPNGEARLAELEAKT